MIPRKNQSIRRSLAKSVQGSLAVLQHFAMKCEKLSQAAAEDAVRAPIIIQICHGLGVDFSSVSDFRVRLTEYSLDDLVNFKNLVKSGKVTWSDGELRLKGFK